jgi:hypothetical protein
VVVPVVIPKMEIPAEVEVEVVPVVSLQTS